MKHRHHWTDEELIIVAKCYQHKGDWKRSSNSLHSAAYQSALNRPEVFVRATAHMTPKVSPYSGSYIIYAYEFTDHSVYVGLTFLEKVRHVQHMVRGPVFRHMQVCPTYEYKIVEKNLVSPAEVAAAEGRWIEHYASKGWTMLNTVRAGGLGTVNIGKWTKEAVFAKAKEFKTRKEWYLKSQFTYGLAKREGWFEQAAAHMPRRVLGIGAGRKVSSETRAKQAAAKIGVKQSKKHRAAKSAGAKKWWASRKAQPPPA